MIILDAFAVVAYLKGEPATGQVRQLLDDDTEASLTALGLAKVLDHLVRLTGVEEDEAVLDVAQLGLANPPPIEPGLAMRAGLLRARHYHRRDRMVSLADCVAAESARVGPCPLATADPHLLDTCREEGIEVIALPDSRGRIWSAR